MKRCNKCSRRKSDSAFNRNGKHRDGTPQLRSVCRSCGSRFKTKNTKPKRCADCGEIKAAKQFRENGIDPYCIPCRNERTYAHKRGAGRAAHNKRVCRYQAKKYATDPTYRKKVAARGAVRYALSKGRLKRPAKCPRCSRSTRLHAHHYRGYDKANWLNIVWRCAKCHRKEEQ